MPQPPSVAAADHCGRLYLRQRGALSSIYIVFSLLILIEKKKSSKCHDVLCDAEVTRMLGCGVGPVTEHTAGDIWADTMVNETNSTKQQNTFMYLNASLT